MQLHVCLLLFIITSDKTLASSDHHCGGNIILDKKPAGHISLTLPGPYTDTNNQPDANLSLCTWFVDIPVGTTVLFTLAELVGGAGSSVSVHCVGAGEDDEQVLEKGRESLLSGCDGNKATITWTNAGHSSVQLDYYVQEDERNSSEGHTTHHPGLVSWSPTGTGFTRTPPVSQDVVRGKEGVRGRRCEGLEWCHGPRAVSGRSSEDQGPPDPTTPLQRLALGGRTDGETLPLPEEAPNNGADTSGTVRLTDSPISASEATHSYFHTQHTLSTDTSNTSSRETNSSNDLAKTQMALTDAAASNSKAALAADKHKHTDAPTHTHTATQTPATASSFSIPALSSSPPPLPQTTWVGGSILITHGGAVGEEKQPRSWANTNAFGSDLTSVTSDPVNSHTKPLQDDSGDAHTETDASPSRGSTGPRPFTAHTTALHARVPTATAASFHPNTKRADSSESTTSEAVSQTAAVESSDKFDSSTELRTPTTSAQSPTNLQSTESFTHSSFTETSKDTQTATQRHLINAHLSTVSSPPGIATVSDETSVFTDSSSTSAAPDATTASVGGYARRPAATAHEKSSTYSQTSLLPLRSSSSISTASALHTYSTFSPLASTHTRIDYKTRPVPETSTTEYTPSHTQYRPLLPSSATHKQTQTLTPTTHFPHLTHKTSNQKEPEEGDAVWRWFPSSTATHSPPVTSNPPLSSATSQPPKYYTVPDQPAAIKVETIELLLQIILEDSGSAYAAGLEEDAAAWVRPYLQKAPGFSRLLGVWSSGHAVQNLVEFKTSGALQWLSTTGAASLLERTGLAQAVREERSLRSAKIANITLGGQQGEVCDWLLQCPSGYECVPQPGTTNYSCSSLCHFDYCHHHGICTHHPGQLPVCRCLVGDDFWYMGRRCDVRMTRARLVGACLAILFIIVTVISVLAVVAVRRYRAALIQAKVDQTRSSYRRFNHFDELSGRFWLRSWAGSADSLDNPAFTRSDELLHLRALDRPCCYHDDTLSLASTCPSHGTRINTIYPHSSQYAWRGSEVSVGDGVLDSGKASDLSVCSWPVEPIQWTPFPLLQQLSSHRTPAVRASRPRSYCEGMELVDLEKSWTA